MDSYVGEVRLYPYQFVLKNWMLCDGRSLDIQTYQALYSILGVQYGGDGRTHFNLPNLQGKVVIGADSEQSLPIGAVGGEASHTLTINEMPQHNHNVAANNTAGTSNTPVNNVWAAYSNNINAYTTNMTTSMNSHAIATTGLNLAHNNMQPYLTLQYCICVFGVYPPR